MMINPAYAATILDLSALLNSRGIPHRVRPMYDGLQIRFPWCDGDFICHMYSHGCNNGDVESMGFEWDNDDVSHLSVEEAFSLVVKLYNTIK